MNRLKADRIESLLWQCGGIHKSFAYLDAILFVTAGGRQHQQKNL